MLFASRLTLAGLLLLPAGVSAAYPGPDSCNPTLWNVASKRCIGQSDTDRNPGSIYGEQLAL